MSEKTVPFGFKDVAPDDKVRRVQGVFYSVASRYDLMNDLMSAGVHRIWKANLIARLNPQPGEVLIDVAGGTGDVARAFLKAAGRRSARGRPPARAIVADINEAMVMAGRRAGEPDVQHVVGDATGLPFADRSADALTISFGIRNVLDIDAALKEFRRVLKPGGRFACLEFSHMPSAGLQALYDQYSFAVIPRLGQMVTGDKDSYQYLVESIRRFPDQPSFARRMSAAGFSGVSWTNYSGGVAALHTGWAA